MYAAVRNHVCGPRSIAIVGVVVCGMCVVVDVLWFLVDEDLCLVASGTSLAVGFCSP